MAKVPHIQEFPYLELDTRKKLDGFTMFSNGETEDMKEANIGKREMQSLESELKYDLRKSLAWDSAFSTSSGILDVEELFNASNSLHSENGCDMLGPEQDQLLSVNYQKPETKNVTSEFNLRKSLAWDSAFFTSEGILNPEELSLLNKGPKKSEMDMLRGIEELWVSSESNCTVDSDGSSLASSTVTSSSRNIQKVYSTKRMDGDCVPKLKVKSRPNSGRQTINDNQPEKIAKESFVSPSLKFSAASGISDLSSRLKLPKISRRVRRNVPIAPIKRIPLFSNVVNGESEKCLTKKSNKLNTSCTTLSWEFSSLSSQSCMNGSTGLCSPYSNSSACNCSLIAPSKHRIITNEITPAKCCHQTYSSVKKDRCCMSPSVSTDEFSPTSSMGESNGSHDDKRIMVINPSSEIKGRNFVSFDTSKPSGLRMPSPKIGFFDVDNILVSIENGGKKSYSKVLSKIESEETLKDVRNTRTCSRKTSNSTISRTMKFGPTAVFEAGEAKKCLRNDEKIVSMTTHEHEVGKQTFARMNKKRVGNKILGEREEQSCLKGKRLLRKEQTRTHIICPGNDPYRLYESDKENLIGFENKLKEQVRTLGVRGDVVIEFVDKKMAI